MNNRSQIPRRAPEASINTQDFSGLTSIPKSRPTVSTTCPTLNFKPHDIKTPENLLQTDSTQQEFEKDIFSSLDLIPDVPFEIYEYKPSNPADVPPYFPQTPNTRLLQPEFLKNYDLYTLFYIFFYFPGTSQQFFAGKELKKRDWVYHKAYKTWYHRLSEPYEKTDEYEIGKFEYFDHLSQEWWRVKQNESFKLEYNLVDNE